MLQFTPAAKESSTLPPVCATNPVGAQARCKHITSEMVDAPDCEKLFPRPSAKMSVIDPPVPPAPIPVAVALFKIPSRMKSSKLKPVKSATLALMIFPSPRVHASKALVTWFECPKRKLRLLLLMRFVPSPNCKFCLLAPSSHVASGLSKHEPTGCSVNTPVSTPEGVQPLPPPPMGMRVKFGGGAAVMVAVMFCEAPAIVVVTEKHWSPV